MKTIAIVGGGFSGTMVAVNLARLAEHPLRVLVINRGRPLGRGAAYGTQRSEHLLNVAARNMSALPDQPDHFVNWLRWRSDYRDMPLRELRESFAPRRVYGDYLCGLLFGCLNRIDERSPVTVELCEDEAIDLEPHGSGGFIVSLATGGFIEADKVILATGNQPPARLSAFPPEFVHPAYVPDPWSDWESRLPAATEDVILLGAGLTMVDAFLTLAAHGWKGRIFAVSRSGLTPWSHFRGIDYPDFPPASPEMLGLNALAELMEDHCQRLRKRGANPAIVVDRLRPHTQRIWRGLSREEKQQFLAQYASRWNVIRHRIAPSIHQSLTQAVDDHRVQIVRGTVQLVEEYGSKLTIALQSEEGTPQLLTAALVINCTGPQPRLSQTELPLIQNLLQRGLARPDELDMSLDVDDEFAVINRDGEPSDSLLAMGPLLKGKLWESTAVPELRGQAFQIARVLLAAEAQAVPSRFQVVEEDVIEYYI